MPGIVAGPGAGAASAVPAVPSAALPSGAAAASRSSIVMLGLRIGSENSSGAGANRRAGKGAESGVPACASNLPSRSRIRTAVTDCSRLTDSTSACSAVRLPENTP